MIYRMSGTTKIGFLVILLVVIMVMTAKMLILPVNDAGAKPVAVVVPQHATTASVADSLEQNGLIRSALAFRLYARASGLDGKLKPGTYNISAAMSVPDMMRELIKGPPDRIKVTFPEGYTLSQMAALLEDKGITDRRSFMEALHKNWDYPYLKDAAVARWGLEGYLYPDTYYLGASTGADKVVDMMLRKFGAVIQEHDYAREAASLGLTLHEALTVASMVEREARVAAERPRIAGVIFNRLKLGMPLQIDATVQYALGKPKEKLYYKDLEVDSPYNTYKISGLPPGPIANPGWPSMQAVINPEKNDYLYYVARPDGTHAFARTLAEHNHNIKMYQ